MTTPSVIVLGVFLLSVGTGIAAQSPLADAAEKSDRATIRTLLKQHADVNAPQAIAPTGLQQTSPGQRPGLTNTNDDKP